MSLDDIQMSSNELLEKEEIDSGGFGKVFLCCHRNYGLVVLKTVFTGCKQQSYKNDLMEEGKLMYKLNNVRVVKLLGVILEDGNYSLVIEYMRKGNLLKVLNQIEVPIALKARFIMEIIEGMIYLHSQKVIHKDLKPENILADDNFHVKIADLGVAAFQKWSTLTKEETYRQKSRSKSLGKTSSAGTLCYMAPEHFKDINKKATEKSDVYSFAIVIWVILSCKEPYENAINEAQLSLGVKDGQRPILSEDILTNLTEAADLMQKCWKDDPNERPSFEDCERQFRPVYLEKYENHIAQDVATFQKEYPAPEAFIQRMASLQLDCDAEAPSMSVRDTPQSLHSSLALGHENVNENFFRASNEPEESEEERYTEELNQKLQVEKNYHEIGSRIDHVNNPSNPAPLSELRSRKVFNEPHPQAPGHYLPSNGAHDPEHCTPVAAGYICENFMHSPETYGRDLNNVEYALPNEQQRMANPHLSATPAITPEPGAYLYEQHERWQEPHGFMPPDSTKTSVTESGPSLYPGPYQYVSDASHTRGTLGNNYFQKGNFGYSPSYGPVPPGKNVNVTISNSSAVQIGNGNFMSCVEPMGMNNYVSQNLDDTQYKHVIQSDTLINDQQLEFLRDNLAKKWKEFARKVGFRQPEIEEIDHDYERDGLKEKVFQMLHKWLMKEGTKNATVGKIAKALFDLGEIDLLNQLIRRS